MKAVLICPGERPDVPFLARESPLALAPVLGRCVAEYWMSQLACAGIKHVLVLAQDRVEEVRRVVGNGARWGVAAEVIAEARELSAEEAAIKYGAPASLMDHFPGLPDYPLFASYGHWFKAMDAWISRAKTPDRVGVLEASSGIWVGLHGHMSPEARFRAPCWLGDHVYVGAGAVVGPGAIVEDGTFIEADAEITQSIVGPRTFVGRYMRIANSLARGNTLVDWQTGLETIVPESFLLCSLQARPSNAKTVPFLDRLAGWLARWTDEESMEPQPLLVKPES
jgi:NDP-sugar pyrophosphorylase family protein